MATVSKWSAVAVAIQSALATAVVITGITKDNPGVVSYTDAGSSDPSNGNYVLLSIQGMHQLDQRVVRVANVSGAGNTFELEGVDTTLFDTFSSGTFEVITFGTSMTTASGLSASGGDFDFIDVTTIHDNVKKQIPGVANPATYTFDSLWDPADAGLVALKTASDNQAVRAVRFSFANGYKVVFAGYIGATLLPVGSAQDKVTTQVVITMFGKPTMYST